MKSLLASAVLLFAAWNSQAVLYHVNVSGTTTSIVNGKQKSVGLNNQKILRNYASEEVPIGNLVLVFDTEDEAIKVFNRITGSQVGADLIDFHFGFDLFAENENRILKRREIFLRDPSQFLGETNVGSTIYSEKFRNDETSSFDGEFHYGTLASGQIHEGRFTTTRVFVPVND